MTAKHSADKQTDSRLADNRHAFYQYEILDKFEAGLVLTGAEVKSIRGHHMNLKASYISIENGEAILKKSHISAYQAAADQKYNPERERKLLLNRKELTFLDTQTSEHGLTIVPLSVYLKKGKVKMQIGLARGKQTFDKRQDLKKKAQDREISRHFRQS
jgi:SsrA-binding protein